MKSLKKRTPAKKPRQRKVSTDHISGGSGVETIVIGDDTSIDFGAQGAAQPSYTLDTISIDPSWTMASSITLPSSTYTISTGSNYSYTTAGSNWGQANVNITANGIDMASGTDLKIDGKSLKEFMNKMEERLAILVPDPKKLEKFEALKKAYEHYKLMEKLCQEEPKEGE